MNLNYETYIKQECLYAEDDVSKCNISVKNEPISDVTLPFVTIKSEPPNEATLTEAGYNKKNEDPVQNKLSIPSDALLIYEPQAPALVKQIQHIQNKLNTRQIINKTSQINTKSNITAQLKPLVADSIQALKQQIASDSATHKNKFNTVLKLIPTTSPPVLLNAKLRKLNKVVIPINPIDKRTRYNIEGATAPMKNLSSTTIDHLNGKDKKIINHFIKNKRSQSKLKDHIIKSLETSRALKSYTSPVPENHNNFRTNETNTETDTHVNLKNASTSTLTRNLNAPKKNSNTPELRVKCLCSLTFDASDNTTYTYELRDFFRKMFEKTRLLKKKQQRKIKMSLLQAISDAEDSMERGKCCSF